MLWVFLTVRMSVFVPHCWISSFWTPPCRRPIVVIIIVWSHPLSISNCTYFSENRFSLHNDISNLSRPA
jgi:hypothetical protein